jgi:hypothetical protein
MAIVGHASAALNVFIDIPPILRAVSQSMLGRSGPNFKISRRLFDELDRNPDPQDPTERVDEYYHDWWNQDSKWRTTPQSMVDVDAAFEFHVKKVSQHFMQVATC